MQLGPPVLPAEARPMGQMPGPLSSLQQNRLLSIITDVRKWALGAPLGLHPNSTPLPSPVTLGKLPAHSGPLLSLSSCKWGR